MPEVAGRAGWAELLDELEQRAAQAVSGTEAPAPWRPPVPSGALPPELAGRADDVLAAQSRAIAEVRAQEQALRSQLGALGTSAHPSAPDVPVYLDTIG